MHLGQLELYSYTALLLGQRQLLLSLAGLLLVLFCCRLWRRQSSASLLAAWLFFLSWLVWAPLVFTPERLQGVQAPIRNYWSAVAPADVFSLCSQSVAHRFRTPPLESLPRLNWNVLIIAGWGLLAGGRAIQLWRRRRRYLDIANRAAPLDDADSRALLERWREVYRVRRPVDLRTSELCLQAFTVGLRHPVIHLPGVYLRALDRAGLDAVIGHEMAHVMRCDDLAMRLQRLLRALFFFNPIFAIANRRIAELREQSCDRLAIRRGRLSVRQYGESLLRILALGRGAERLPDDVAGIGSASLRRRIESLMQGDRRFSWRPVACTALLLVGLSLLFGHTGSDPMRGADSARVLAGIGAVSPVPGRQMMSKPFIWPNQCVFGAIDPKVYHPGVDFAAPAGSITYVRAIADGKVVHASLNSRLAGWQVHVRHADGVVSTYLYLDRVSVQAGDRVAAGDPIARNDGSGHRHVHVEVHQRGRVLDASHLLTLER